MTATSLRALSSAAAGAWSSSHGSAPAKRVLPATDVRSPGAPAGDAMGRPDEPAAGPTAAAARPLYGDSLRNARAACARPARAGHPLARGGPARPAKPLRAPRLGALLPPGVA